MNFHLVERRLKVLEAPFEHKSVKRNKHRRSLLEKFTPLVNCTPVVISFHWLRIERCAVEDHPTDDVGNIDLTLRICSRYLLIYTEKLLTAAEVVTADIELVRNHTLLTNV